jgi:hypothetical protein
MRRQCGRGAKGIETLPGGHSDSKTIEPRCIVSDDLALVHIGKVGEGAVDHSLRMRKRALIVWIVASPQNTPRTGSRSVFGCPLPR